MSKCSIAVAVVLGALAISTSGGWAQSQTLWKFNNLSKIGGQTPKLEGAPKLVDSPVGKAVQFNGAARRCSSPARWWALRIHHQPPSRRRRLRAAWMHIAETDPRPGWTPAASDPNPRHVRGAGQDANDNWMPSSTAPPARKV